MKKALSLKFIVFLLFFGGICLVSSGYYIKAKACVAQLLLENAWQRSIKNGGSPVKPWPWADTWPVARLQWPEEGISLIVLEGAFGNALAFGPGRMENSAVPGTTGISVICGHRDTVFSFLKHVKYGEKFFMQTRDGRQKQFVVTGITIQDARDIRLQEEADEPRLTLVTCYPFDGIVSSSFRYLVYAEAVKS